MTCKEQYIKDHPDCSKEAFMGVMRNMCPHDYGYLDEAYWCNGRNDDNCKKCWNRKIPEDDKKPVAFKPLVTDKIKDDTCRSCIHYGGTFGSNTKLCRERPYNPVVGNVISCEYYVSNEEEVNEFTKATMDYISKTFDLPKEIIKPSIKDSGARIQFATGAVTDSHDGKGRCDLMPLDVVAGFRGQILNDIYDYQTSGDPKYLKIALQKFIDKYMKDMSTALLEVSIHFEEGAKKYGEHNWQKGIPTHRHIDSAVRHYLKFMRGDKDEPHDRAFIWRLLCCIWTCIHKPELNDYSKENKE